MPDDASPQPSELALTSRVPPWAAGSQLLDYLCRRFPYLDRAGWRAAIDARQVDLDDRPATAELVLRAGARVRYRRQHVEPKVATDIGILHLDDHLVVAVKPAHLPMHADGAFVRATFVHILQQRLGASVRLVHRLDRETSGVVVAARSKAAGAHLLAQFAAGTVGKRYLAIVHGVVAADAFTVEAPIGHAVGSAIALRRAVVAAGTPGAGPARTDFVVRHRGAAHTVLHCTPHTGRTHQIRVHLEHVGHPLLGDVLYGRSDADYLAFVHAVKAGGDPQARRTDGTQRQLLHADELTFAHPADGRRVTFQAPAPDDWRPWLPPG